MKAIMISIRPEWVAKILNGEKTIEIRKKFPSDYVGWVYIYCTKTRPYLTRGVRGDVYPSCVSSQGIVPHHLNSRVVARFWCDKVEEILSKENGNFYTNFLSNRKLLNQSCLAQNELRDYMASNWKQKFGYWYGGYAIHITKLEIFDKPKEISEFRRYCDKHFNWWTNRCLDCKAYTPDTDIEDYCNKNKLALTRAPESWCYVEI